MKQKYIEELLRLPLFIFGEGPNGVDIANCDDCSVLKNIPRGVAERVCEESQQFLNALTELLKDV